MSTMPEGGPALGFGRSIVLTSRDRDRSPAMCCVVEFEDVLKKMTDAVVMTVVDDVPKSAVDTVFAVILRPYLKTDVTAKLRRYRRAGARIIVYIFDPWAWQDRTSPRQRVSDMLRGRLRLAEFCDVVCVPFDWTLDAYRAVGGLQVLHIPLAVDTTKSDGGTDHRPIDILAYGRQPPELMERLSVRYNGRGLDHPSQGILYHTGHTEIGRIKDFIQHRAMFWSVSSRAQIAMAYDLALGGIRPATEKSIVSQRYYENFAAGCVVVGRRGSTEPFDSAFNWEEPIIELSVDWGEAEEAIAALLEDPVGLLRRGARNRAGVVAHHDWRHRIVDIADALR